MGNKVFLTVLLAGLLACPVTVLTAAQPPEQPPELVAEEVAERAAEKAIEKAEEKAEETAVAREERPDKWKGPTRVLFVVFVVDIDNIDGAAQTFSANIYVRLRWKDERLMSDGWSPRQMSLGEVWNPRVLLANEGGIVRSSLPEVVEVAPDGTVTYRQRYVGPISQLLRLSDFPLDEHHFVIQFVAAGYPIDELEFVPDVLHSKGELIGGGIADQLSLQDWKILDYEIIPRPYAPVAEIEAAGFAFAFTAKRFFIYYVWQLFVPLSVIVAMSWGAFWIDPRHTGAQIGVATSSILTLIAYRFVVAGLLPRLPYMTRLDYFVLGSTLLVFLALVEVILTSYMTRDDLRGRARKIDRVSRVVFPVLFLLLYVGCLYF